MDAKGSHLVLVREERARGVVDAGKATNTNVIVNLRLTLT